MKHCIVIDWLEFICTGDVVHYEIPLENYDYDFGRIQLKKLPHGSKHFKYAYEIIHDGQKFATCFVCSRAPEMINPKFIQVKIENNILYEFAPVARCEYVFGKLGWDVRNVSRIDIALDGVNVLGLIEDLDKKVIAKYGKATYNVYHTGKGVITGIDVGSKKSSKWGTAYDKSRELEKSNKLYIRDWWKKSGIDILKPVERMEIKLRNEALKKLDDFDWKMCDNVEYLASMMQTFCDNFFEFHLLDDDNVSRCTKVMWCDWDSIGSCMLPKCSTKKSNEIYRMKLTSKMLFQIYFETGIKHYADFSQEIAFNINCLDWYIKNIDKWKSEWQYLKSKGGGQYVIAFEQYEDNKQLALFETVDMQNARELSYGELFQQF